MAYVTFDIPVVKASVYTAAAPQQTFGTLPAGVLVRVDVIVPHGVAALAGIRFNLAGAVSYPSTASTYFVTNGETISIPENFDMRRNTVKSVKFETYNLDDTYDHTFTVRFTII